MSTSEERREYATEVVRRLRQAGFTALWAGGCVRDLVLGLPPADYDVATSATPEQVMGLFRHRTIPVGAAFGVVRVRNPKSSAEVEVATFRSDGAYVDGRHPESVTFSSPEQDAARRDFTINGMFYEPFTEEVIDYVGGLNDLRAGILRAIGDPRARFREDKLRLLRAVRFASRFHLTIDPGTRAAIKEMAAEVSVVAAERITQELRRMLVDPSRAEAMELALELGLIRPVLPPLLAIKGIFQGKPVQPEGDLWDHTMLVLKLLPATTSFPLALAALLHDIGKPVVKTIIRGRLSFHNHEQVGRNMADDLCRKLRLSKAERDRVDWLVEYHQYLGEAKRLREAKLKRMLAQPGIEELLALHRADAMASVGEAPHVDYCEYYLRAQPAGAINPPPLVTGHDLARLGLTPGPAFSQLLDQVREAQLDGLVTSKREALDWLCRRLELRAD